MARRKVNEEMLETLREFNEKGMTVPAISREMGISAPTIYKYLEIMQLQPNGRKTVEVDHKALIAAYKDQDRTVQSVINEFGISTTALYGILRKNGEEPRQSSPEAKKQRQEQLEYALELYQNSDKTVMVICLETGVSQPMLHREIRERGIPFRNPKMAAPTYDDRGEVEVEKWDE